MRNQGYDYEDQNLIQEDEYVAMKDASSQARLGFIRKVYAILSCQLLFTVFLTLISMVSSSFAQFQRNQAWLVYLCMFVSIASCCAIVCFKKVARQVPYNYLTLGTFTVAESYLVSFICAFTEAKLVFVAAVLTLGIVVALTAYAVYTKTDFTMMGGMLFCFAMSMVLFGLLCWLINVYWLHQLYCVLGVLLFSVYLIYDTQLIVGGKHHELSIDDYIIGALQLYLDIINIFLYILSILRGAD